MEREITKKAFDGVELYGKVNVLDTPRAAIVMIHGLCEHQGRYDYVAGYLNRQGFGTYRFDLRGHGRSGGPRTYYSHEEEIIKDAKVFVDLALKENPGLPVFVFGHSLGGYAAAYFGTKWPGLVKGFVTTGAWTRDNKEALIGIPDGLDPNFETDNTLADAVCSDRAVVEAYKNDPYTQPKVTLGLFYAVKKGHAWMKENATLFTDPVIVMHGASDMIVSEKDSRDFFGEIGSEDKSLFIYSGLWHEILNEPCKDRILGDITEWLNERI